MITFYLFDCFLTVISITAWTVVILNTRGESWNTSWTTAEL